MATFLLSFSFVALLGSLPCLPTALPMTDYSQLNHDEPTHWTRAATTQGSVTETTWAASGSDFNTEASSVTSSQIPSTGGTNRVSRQETTSAEATVTPTTSSTDRPLNTSHPIVELDGPTNTSSVLERFFRLKEKSVPPDDVGIESNYFENGGPPEESHGLFEDEPNESQKATSRNGSEVFERDNDLGDKKEEDEDMGVEIRNPLPTYKTILVNKIDDIGFDSDQEEEEMKKDERPNSLYDNLGLNHQDDEGPSYFDSETPFKSWDAESEEQEKFLETIGNETEENLLREHGRESGDHQSQGRWFILLLAGNSTIVRLRQKDFAKYLKLNLAARLSLEYDELRVNKVVLAPPRLMVNVSVVPSEMSSLDDEFDLNERLFGEEDAPLHKLAETNATLLELSGEEYHVVRFLSLKSEQPVSLDESSPATSVIISDKHSDIEKVVYWAVGGACLVLLVPLFHALCKMYIFPMKIKLPWKREKLFGSKGPRHQRMEEPNTIGGPLTVIYSGSFVERNGPPSGSWLDDNPQNSNIFHEEPGLENPVYGYSKSVLPDPGILDSPRFNIDSKLHILGCRPNHLLLPHTPVKHKNTLDVRIPTKGVENPNYQT